jgi:hypothetical protein
MKGRSTATSHTYSASITFQSQLDKGTTETGNMLTTTIDVPPLRRTISLWRKGRKGGLYSVSEPTVL